MLAIAGQLRPEMLDLIASEEALIELDAQGLLEYGSGGSVPYVRLAHPMVADALRSGLDAHERRQRLVTLVEASSDLANPDELDVLQALHWAIEVGHELPAEELHAGSALALRHMDYALAADIAGEQQRREPSAQAAFVHAVALARAARFDEALEIADQARSLAAEPDDVVALARILVRLHSPFGRTLGFVGGRPEVAAEVAAWADERLGGRSFTTLLESYTTFVDGDLAGAVDLAAEVSVDEGAIASGAVREADEHLMLIAPLAGRFDLARTSQARLSSTGRGALHIPGLMGAEGATASLLMYDGRLRDALAADEAAFARAERVLAYDEMMNAAAQRGIRSYLMGDLDHTVEALELSLRYRVVPSSRSLLVHGILAAARARRGELATAVRTLDQADLEREVFSSILLNLDYDHLSTFVRGAAGVLDPDEASERLHRIAADAAAFGYQWLHANTRLSIVRLGAVQPDDATALAEVAAAIDAPLIRSVAGVVVAAADADFERLLGCADELAAMGAHGFEVDAAAAAVAVADGADAERARSRLDQAVASCTGLVLAAPRRSAGRSDPSGDPDGSERSVLTEREAEIARLAADGLASKEIAARLDLSSRTVDNTLRRVYSKLGIAGRRELRAALHR
jgi:DNA-binding CsgD family transcriptional regulator